MKSGKGEKMRHQEAQTEAKMQHRRKEAGSALVELAVLLPLVGLLLAGVIEVGNALNAYLTIAEASRDGARLIVRQGPTADVQGLVQTLTQRLPNSTLTATPTYGMDAKGDQTITVEVRYDYEFLFGNVLADILPNPFRLTAQTTMPIP